MAKQLIVFDVHRSVRDIRYGGIAAVEIVLMAVDEHVREVVVTRWYADITDDSVWRPDSVRHPVPHNNRETRWPIVDDDLGHPILF